MNYLVEYLSVFTEENQLLLQTFLILIYNNNEFGAWVYDIYCHCDLKLATEFVISVIEKYLQQHGFTQPP
ncbi:hypothetical protein [Endozoicomonas lisbonensis]